MYNQQVHQAKWNSKYTLLIKKTAKKKKRKKEEKSVEQMENK